MIYIKRTKEVKDDSLQKINEKVKTIEKSVNEIKSDSNKMNDVLKSVFFGGDDDGSMDS